MRHFFFFPVLALPLILACNARVVSGDATGNGEENLANAGSDAHKGADAGAGTGCGSTDAGAGDAAIGDAGATGTCGTPDGTLHTFTSAADMHARLRGSWLTCGGFIDQPAGTIGIEFEGSQAWFLVEGPHGTAVRGVGTAYERTVSILDDIAMNGPGAYRFQMDLAISSGAFDTYFIDSFDHPSKLVLNEGTSGNVAEYTPTSSSGGGTDAGLIDAGTGDDAGFEGDGDTFADGGWTEDGGSEDGSTSSCSLVGSWGVTSNVPFGNLSSFLFLANGSFVGGPISASLPTGETFSGDWSIAPDGEVSISNTTGMLCNSGSTNMSVTWAADCATVTLDVVTDACTGAREQLDDTTVLVRR